MDLQSQEAYEMAKTGLIRPKNTESGPVIYGMKCIEFNPPDFSLGESPIKSLDIVMKYYNVCVLLKGL